MQLKEEISEELYEVIAQKYENGDYTGAITDSIKHLTDLIRSTINSSEDGQKLVAEAFDGNSPILKFTKMESESEINDHKGLTFLLKGIYMGIRNPRAHELYADSKEDCDSLIIFINYMIEKIPVSQKLFDLDIIVEK